LAARRGSARTGLTGGAHQRASSERPAGTAGPTADSRSLPVSQIADRGTAGRGTPAQVADWHGHGRNDRCVRPATSWPAGVFVRAGQSVMRSPDMRPYVVAVTRPAPSRIRTAVRGPASQTGDGHRDGEYGEKDESAHDGQPPECDAPRRRCDRMPRKRRRYQACAAEFMNVSGRYAIVEQDTARVAID
jgi:hypothetical protein